MPEERRFGAPSHSLALALCFVAVLAITILINGWLLHIVLLAYFHMKKLEMESCSSERQQKLLLVVPMRRRTLLADTTPMVHFLETDRDPEFNPAGVIPIPSGL
uniref:G_PROTEIN_RECEP_F1_2 domain-containing protein n=1 Tax=Globodera pallida TaxID=36090 RepID=A0A183BJ24_GLOPA